MIVLLVRLLAVLVTLGAILATTGLPRVDQSARRHGPAVKRYPG